MLAPPNVEDSDLPSLARALDATEMQVHLEQVLAAGKRKPRVELRRACLLRHKIGRRCLIEYRIRLWNGSSASSLTALGKMRRRKVDRRTYRTMTALWNGGFDTRSRDRVSVPRPLGLIPGLRMWLQVKVPGVTTTEMLGGAGGVDLARRLADAIYKLHAEGPPANRRHSTGDELEILRDRLARVEAMRPRWSGRLRRVVDGCARLARGLSTARCTAIHRDFYPDQVLVGRTGRLFLLDLDLYAMGDPMLDVGNFTGHLIELAIREPSRSRSLTAAIAAFESRYLERVGAAAARALSVYTTLTLARHIYLSTRCPGRERTTLRLLHLCEERLAAVERVGRVKATHYVTEVCQ